MLYLDFIDNILNVLYSRESMKSDDKLNLLSQFSLPESRYLFCLQILYFLSYHSSGVAFQIFQGLSKLVLKFLTSHDALLKKWIVLLLSSCCRRSVDVQAMASGLLPLILSLSFDGSWIYDLIDGLIRFDDGIVAIFAVCNKSFDEGIQFIERILNYHTRACFDSNCIKILMSFKANLPRTEKLALEELLLSVCLDNEGNFVISEYIDDILNKQSNFSTKSEAVCRICRVPAGILFQHLVPHLDLFNIKKCCNSAYLKIFHQLCLSSHEVVENLSDFSEFLIEIFDVLLDHNMNSTKLSEELLIVVSIFEILVNFEKFTPMVIQFIARFCILLDFFYENNFKFVNISQLFTCTSCLSLLNSIFSKEIPLSDTYTPKNFSNILKYCAKLSDVCFTQPFFTFRPSDTKPVTKSKSNDIEVKKQRHVSSEPSSDRPSVTSLLPLSAAINLMTSLVKLPDSENLSRFFEPLLTCLTVDYSQKSVQHPLFLETITIDWNSVVSSAVKALASLPPNFLLSPALKLLKNVDANGIEILKNLSKLLLNWCSTGSSYRKQMIDSGILHWIDNIQVDVNNLMSVDESSVTQILNNLNKLKSILLPPKMRVNEQLCTSSLGKTPSTRSDSRPSRPSTSDLFTTRELPVEDDSRQERKEDRHGLRTSSSRFEGSASRLQMTGLRASSRVKTIKNSMTDLKLSSRPPSVTLTDFRKFV
ncbi:hypothetical protein GEMRC1_003857 [Eukaryota sp. GEM-RC1]